jgi:hypothetical protein
MGAASLAGGSIGNILGGLLVEPAGRIPVVGQIELFVRKPFALPGIALSVW